MNIQELIDFLERSQLSSFRVQRDITLTEEEFTVHGDTVYLPSGVFQSLTEETAYQRN